MHNRIFKQKHKEMKEENKNNTNYKYQYQDGECWLNKVDENAGSDELFERAKAYHMGLGTEMDRAKAALLYQQAMGAGSKKAKHNLAMMFVNRECESGTPEMGARMLRELAEEGDADALYCLGGCYYEGKGVEQDMEKGVAYYKTASEKGCSPATLALGVYYNNELGDIEKGLEYIRKSADEGFATANYLLSDLYEKGFGVEKDMEKSFAYLKRAAELGDAVSQFKYGYLLLYGHHEFTEGAGWLRKAAAQGIEGPRDVLQSLGIEEEMTVEERSVLFYETLGDGSREDADAAFQKMNDCMMLGDPVALYTLGLGSYEGVLMQQDKELGMKLLLESANMGLVDAISIIGLLLNREKRYVEANAYFKKAAEMGDHHAIHNLGNAYFYARGMEQDVEKGIQLWMKAASMGNPESMCTIGTCYLRGEILKQDINKAIEYLTRSAELGNTLAMQRLAEVYHLAGDHQKAQYWEDMQNPN